MDGGKAMVKIFERAGIDYIFSSPGTEWPPVWEAFAEVERAGRARNSIHQLPPRSGGGGDGFRLHKNNRQTAGGVAPCHCRAFECGDVLARRLSGARAHGHLLRRNFRLRRGIAAAGPGQSVDS